MDQCSKIIRKFIIISNVWQKIKIEGGGTLPVKSWNHGDDLTVAISVNKARLADKVPIRLSSEKTMRRCPTRMRVLRPIYLDPLSTGELQSSVLHHLILFLSRTIDNDESIIYHVYAEIMSSWKNKSITCHFFASFLEQQFYM